MKKTSQLLALVSLVFLLSACTATPEPKLEVKPLPKPTVKPISIEKKLKVTATAYTSSRRETDKTPFLAAWMNKLKPGVKSIAVSRDLLTMGLGNGSMVTIDGLPGKYKVLDKMNKRWTKKIDLYMGLNRKRALQWGNKSVVIRWKKTDKELLKEYRVAEAIESARLKELALKKKESEGAFSYVTSLFS